MNKILLFGLIATVLSINAFAVSSTVTSQDYVDAKDALKQDIIETGLVEAPEGHGDYGEGVDLNIRTSVATYDETDGLVANKVGIATWSNFLGNETWPQYVYKVSRSDDRAAADKLIPTLGALIGAIEDLQPKKRCVGWPDGVAHTYENCWLWSFGNTLYN